MKGFAFAVVLACIFTAAAALEPVEGIPSPAPTFFEGFSDAFLGWTYPLNIESCFTLMPDYSQRLYTAIDDMIFKQKYTGFF